MANISRKKLDLIFKIIVCVLLVALIGGVTYAIVRVVHKDETKEISSLAYKIGALDDNGAFMKNTASIVSKDFISSNGLTIKLQENAEVSYKVFFYDADKAFVSASSRCLIRLCNANSKIYYQLWRCNIFSYIDYCFIYINN